MSLNTISHYDEVLPEHANSRCHFTRVQRENDGVIAFPFQLGCHMSEHLIQCCLRCCVGGKAVFHFPEALHRARIAGHEDDGTDLDGALEQSLGAYDGADGVGVEVECEIVKGPGDVVRTALPKLRITAHARLQMKHREQSRPCRRRR